MLSLNTHRCPTNTPNTEAMKVHPQRQKVFPSLLQTTRCTPPEQWNLKEIGRGPRVETVTFGPRADHVRTLDASSRRPSCPQDAP